MRFRFVAFILTICIFTSAVSKTLLFIHYNLNVEVYAKACVNKAKPAMHCEGKCHLKKEMAKDDQKEKSSTKVETNIVLFIEQFQNIFFQNTSENFLAEPVKKIHLGFLSPVFHPPLG